MMKTGTKENVIEVMMLKLGALAALGLFILFCWFMACLLGS